MLDNSNIIVVVSSNKKTYSFLKKHCFLKISYLALNFAQPVVQRVLFERSALLIFELPEMNNQWESALAKIKSRYAYLKILVLTRVCAYASISRLLQSNAHFFFDEPLRGEALLERVRQMTAYQGGKENLSQDSYLITRSKFMHKVRHYVNNLPSHFRFILLSGETGTGKTSLAHWIHRSHFSQKPFIEVNAGSICDNLHNSELFGSMKGAFTGAIARDGLFHASQESVILINEIQNFSHTTQRALLQVFDNGRFYRLGSNRNEILAAKVICTVFSPRNEDRLVVTDLWYRIAQFRIHLPALRERPEDIPQLARHFLARINSHQSWSKTAIKLLQEQPWPGNLRQLYSLTESLSTLYLASSKRLRITDKDVKQALNDFQGG